MVLKRCSHSASLVPSTSPVTLSVTPSVSQFDEKVHIQVRGLPSKVKVTLHASTEQEWQRKPAQFVSCAHYLSSGEGQVDVAADHSQGGTYTGE